MMKPCIFLPGEYIVHKGDMGLGMFFLYHGTVSSANYHMLQIYVYVYIYYGIKSSIIKKKKEYIVVVLAVSLIN